MSKFNLKDLKTPGVNVQLWGVRLLDQSLHKARFYEAEVGILKDKELKKLAIWQEYGTKRNGKKHIPPRSFLRASRNEAAPEIQGQIANEIIKEIMNDLEYRSQIKGLQDHTPPPISDTKLKKIFLRAGLELRDYMKDKIYSHISPKLKKATVKAKKRKGYPLPDTPLIATGKMAEALDVRVRRREGTGVLSYKGGRYSIKVE